MYELALALDHVRHTLVAVAAAAPRLRGALRPNQRLSKAMQLSRRLRRLQQKITVQVPGPAAHVDRSLVSKR